MGDLPGLNISDLEVFSTRLCCRCFLFAFCTVMEKKGENNAGFRMLPQFGMNLLARLVRDVAQLLVCVVGLFTFQLCAADWKVTCLDVHGSFTSLEQSKTRVGTGTYSEKDK